MQTPTGKDVHFQTLKDHITESWPQIEIKYVKKLDNIGHLDMKMPCKMKYCKRKMSYHTWQITAQELEQFNMKHICMEKMRLLA